MRSRDWPRLLVVCVGLGLGAQQFVVSPPSTSSQPAPPQPGASPRPC